MLQRSANRTARRMITRRNGDGQVRTYPICKHHRRILRLSIPESAARQVFFGLLVEEPSTCISWRVRLRTQIQCIPGSRWRASREPSKARIVKRRLPEIEYHRSGCKPIGVAAKRGLFQVLLFSSRANSIGYVCKHRTGNCCCRRFAGTSGIVHSRNLSIHTDTRPRQ